jgi:hypothetical protein
VDIQKMNEALSKGDLATWSELYNSTGKDMMSMYATSIQIGMTCPGTSMSLSTGDAVADGVISVIGEAASQ